MSDAVTPVMGAGGNNAEGALWRAMALSGIERSAAAIRRSQGVPLPRDQAGRFGPALGIDVDGVQLHVDADAHEAAAAVDARAVTVGRHIYFGRGEYQPGTAAGDQLLAHELIHTTQLDVPAARDTFTLSEPRDPNETAATRAEVVPIPAFPSSAELPLRAGDVGSGAPMAARDADVRPFSKPQQRAGGVEAGDVAPAPRSGELRRWLGPAARVVISAGRLAHAYASRNDVIELQGKPELDPSWGLADWIEYRWMAGEDTEVRWRFGDRAEGRMTVSLNMLSGYSAEKVAADLRVSNIGTEVEGYTPRLVVGVANSVVTGLFGGVSTNLGNTAASAVESAIRAEGASRLMLWRGLENLREAARSIPSLADGHLRFDQRFDFDLSNTFRANGRLQVTHDGELEFDGTARIDVAGLASTEVRIRRSHSELAISGQANVDLQDFGGAGVTLRVLFREGVLDLRGTAEYRSPGGDIDASLTLMVTDADSAWRAVDGELATWGAAGISPGPPNADGTPPSADPAAATAVHRTPSTRLVVAGWGVGTFRYKDWLEGTAQVIVAPDGEILSMGRIRVPRSIVFLQPRVWSWTIVPHQELRWLVASFWRVGKVEVVASVGLTGEVGVGPGLIHELEAEGRFSSRRSSDTFLRIGGALSIDAYASLKLRASVGVTAGAGVPFTDYGIDFVRGDVIVKGQARVDASAEARAAISRTAGPNPEYVLSGNLALRGSARVDVTGSLDAQFLVVSPRNLANLDILHYDFGELSAHYNFRRYLMGSAPQAPRKFIGRTPTARSLANHALYGRRGGGRRAEDDGRASWQELGRGEEVHAMPEATPPTLPPPADFGQPAVPPFAPPPPVAEEPADLAPAPPPPPPAPPEPASDPNAIVDAGVPAPAGVPMVEPPLDLPVPPPAPAPQPDVGELNVRFTMENTPHQLTLEPAHPPVLIMSSIPGELEDKLDRKLQQVEGQIASQPAADVEPTLLQEQTALTDLKAEAAAVERRAELLQVGEAGVTADPGVRPLAQHLHTAGDQFDWHDLDTPRTLRSDPDLPQVQSELPPPPDRAPFVLPGVTTFDELIAQIGVTSTTRSRPECIALMREQKAHYDRELSAIDAYLDSLRFDQTEGGTSSPYGRHARERRREVLDHITRLLRDILTLEYREHPDERMALPCFSVDTPVLTPAGSMPMGEVREGDAIFCMSEGSTSPVVGTVAAVRRGLTMRFFRIHAAGQSVRATSEHPFWVEERAAWLPAAELRGGMTLRLSDGRAACIDRVEIERVVDAPTVDLTIDPHPTYFVGDESAAFWVHNVLRPTFRTPEPPPPGQPDNPLPGGPHKIYLGRYVPEGPEDAADAAEFANCIYVGQTNRTIRENEHRQQADIDLQNPNLDARHRRFYRFKRRMRLDFIIEGLLTTHYEVVPKSKYATYLEQQNFDIETRARSANQVMNLIRPASPTEFKNLKTWILQDGRAREYCP